MCGAGGRLIAQIAIERIDDVVDAVLGQKNFDDVEPHGHVEITEFFDILCRHFADFAAFAIVYRFGGRAEFVAQTGFYFHENKRRGIGCDNIEFADIRGKIAVKDFVSRFFELFARDIFARLSFPLVIRFLRHLLSSFTLLCVT